MNDHQQLISRFYDGFASRDTDAMAACYAPDVRFSDPVHNRIDARFTFADGKILSHIDTFDLWRWTRMALGLPGVLLGWSPWLHNKIRAEIGGRLQRYMAEQTVSPQT